MKRLLIALSIFILLASIATGIYFLFFTPRAQAQRVADSTMEAAFMQDQRAFAQYTKTNDSDILYAAAHQRNYRLDSLAHVDETFYVRYSLHVLRYSVAASSRLLSATLLVALQKMTPRKLL